MIGMALFDLHAPETCDVNRSLTRFPSCYAARRARPEQVLYQNTGSQQIFGQLSAAPGCTMNGTTGCPKTGTAASETSSIMSQALLCALLGAGPDELEGVLATLDAKQASFVSNLIL